MHGSRSLLVHLIHSVISLPPPLEKKKHELGNSLEKQLLSGKGACDQSLGVYQQWSQS